MRAKRPAMERRGRRYARHMLGDREAVVTGVKSFDLHGVTYYDLALIFSDGSTQSARLGPEVGRGFRPRTTLKTEQARHQSRTCSQPEGYRYCVTPLLGGTRGSSHPG